MDATELTIKSVLAFIGGAVAMQLWVRLVPRYRRWRNARAADRRAFERQLGRMRGDAE